MNVNGAARRPLAGALGEKRITRAASKDVGGGVSKAASKGPLADHGNAKQDDHKPVLRTKLEAKAALAKAAETSEDRAEKAAAIARSAARFEEIVGGCAEYSADMEQYIFWLQKKHTVNEDFLAEREVTPKMRSILVDWLVEVHVRFHMLPETFYGTIGIVDRYLSCGPVDKTNLQLVGVASMCISAKYEEIYAPELQDYEFITDNSATRKDIIRMELKVLSTLRGELGRPTVILFVRRLSVYFNASIHSMAKYIAEIAVCEYTTCHLLPSTIGAVAVWISAFLHNAHFPTAVFNVARMSLAAIREMAPIFARVVQKYQANKKLIALRTKYSSSRNGRVSDMSHEFIDRLDQLAADDFDFASLP